MRKTPHATAARSRTRPAAALLAVSLGGALGVAGCRRETDGQTAVLLDLSTGGPIDCLTLEEGPAAQNDAGGQALSQTQSLKIGAALPDAFLKSFRTAKTTALVYAGRDLGDSAVVVQAEGHRGGCDGAVVARYGPATLPFTQGQVTPVDARLLLLGTDADHDGYAAGDDCNDSDPTIYPGAPELCDGKDHSCSGVPDKGCPCTAGQSRGCYPTPLGTADPHLNVGLCKAGVQSCAAGKWDGLCAGAILPEQEQCDGQDHDCDGVVGLPSCPCTPGATKKCFTKGRPEQADVGRCKSGVATCDGSGFWGACAGEVGPLPFELCNGIDDNCDGQIDELVDAQGRPAMVRPACGNQNGVCSDSKARCVNGAFVACTTADYQAAAASHGTTYSSGSDAPACDGIDHNCDGIIGDGCNNSCSGNQSRQCYSLGLSNPTIGKGICKAGTQSCLGGQWGPCLGQQLPKVESCNGLDDDCNGVVDDLTLGEGASCDTHQPGVCAAGVSRCVTPPGGTAALSCVPITAPSAEVCDGLDNNCNGTVDEGFDKQNDPAHCGGPNDCTACARGNLCCAGRCSDSSADPLHCGSCGKACAPGQGCCGGGCVDLQGSAAHCGSCGHVCDAGLVCRGGQCVPAVETNCMNGVDDDHNGLTDCQDPACDGKACDTNGGTCKGAVCVAACSGTVDCADPHCKGKRCAGNGICTADLQCVVEICNNKVDDNGDGLIDCQDALACPAPGGLGKPLCCGVTWVDAQNDVHHCGDCATDCTAGHSGSCGTISCVAGKCAYGSQPDRTTCPSGVCCRGNCVPDQETSCTDGIDNNCDGKTDCQDASACPAPGGATRPLCCGTSWVDVDHGDTANCGGCGVSCAPPPDSCHGAVCLAGGHCGVVTLCNVPGCDLKICGNSGGTTELCAGGSCCPGCVANNLTCQGGGDLHACVSAAGTCEDCQPSANPCLTDQCTAAGCKHTPVSGSCTAGGKPGQCNAGVCCTGCVDGSGVCQPIDGVNRCAAPGAACGPGCDDGNPCTADSCSTSGTCVHASRDGLACTGGVCAGTQCCSGCIDGTDTCQPGNTAGVCGASGAAWGICPVPSSFCQQATCPAGSCGVAPAHEGQSCPLVGGASGTCVSGTCTAAGSCPDSRPQCNGVCCGSGMSCNGSNVCACDTTGGTFDCARAGGCCSLDTSPRQCLTPSYETCSRCNEIFCSSSGDTGTCLGKSQCASKCGIDVVACGGNECLVPSVAGNGPSGHLNICSTPTNAQSCRAGGVCSCTQGDPTSCPNGSASVCRSPFTGSVWTCHACGDFNTNGLPCTGGGTCTESSGNCN